MSQIDKQAERVLAKNSSETLLSKLRGEKLIRKSYLVAVEILQKRGVDVTEFDSRVIEINEQLKQEPEKKDLVTEDGDHLLVDTKNHRASLDGSVEEQPEGEEPATEAKESETPPPATSTTKVEKPSQKPEETGSRKRMTPEEKAAIEEQIIALSTEGKSVREVADVLGLSYEKVYDMKVVLKKAGKVS